MSIFYCFSREKKYQALHACTTSMFVFRSMGAWERGYQIGAKSKFLFSVFNLQSYLRQLLLETALTWDSSYLRQLLLETALSWESSYLRKLLLEKALTWDSSYLRQLLLEKVLTWDSSYLRKYLLEKVLTWDSSYLRQLLLENAIPIEYTVKFCKQKSCNLHPAC